MKPSRGEFESFAGRTLTKEELAAEGERLVQSGKVENVAITLGRDGAILASRDGTVTSPAIPVEACSAVGAGDSFLAGMVYGFSLGRPAELLAVSDMVLLGKAFVSIRNNSPPRPHSRVPGASAPWQDQPCPHTEHQPRERCPCPVRI